ncbi:MAG TPA: hypothetical protein VIF62_10565 [Labilithrix sp.]
MIRPSASSLFVVAAAVAATAVAVVGQRAAAKAPALDTAIPSDAKLVGFEPRGRAGEVALLEATRPFTLALGNGPVRGEPADAKDLAMGRAIVSRELARYPSSFPPRVHLAGVVVASELVEGEKPIPSLPNVGGLLLLDVHAAESDLVRAIHHEVFHFADLADDGQLAPDPTWEALNARGFVYGGGGRSLRSAWAAKPSSDLPGFVSGYATSGVEEDKADTFAFLVARRESIEPRLGGDPVLAAKAREIVRRVADIDDAAPRALQISWVR